MLREVSEAECRRRVRGSRSPSAPARSATTVPHEAGSISGTPVCSETKFHTQLSLEPPDTENDSQAADSI